MELILIDRLRGVGPRAIERWHRSAFHRHRRPAGEMPTTSVRRRISWFEHAGRAPSPVGPGEDRAHHGGHGDWALLGRGRAGCATNASGSGASSPLKRGRDRVDQAGMGIGSHEATRRAPGKDRPESSGRAEVLDELVERAQEGEPGGAVLAGDDVQAERLAKPSRLTATAWTTQTLTVRPPSRGT